MPDWFYPETWNVGDNLDAVTLNRRIRDQNTVLLRRPLLVAHQSADWTLNNGVDSLVSFDTIDLDDDGLAMMGTPVNSFTVQREGTYQIWYNVTGSGTGNVCPNLQCSIWLNNTSVNRRWDVQARGATSTGQQFCRSINGTVFLSVGETITCHAFQNSGLAMTVKAVNNTPRIAIMWLGIS